MATPTRWTGAICANGVDVSRVAGESRGMSDIDDATRTEIEAAAFRRLVKHLRERPEVQNIDLMNLADFCRNCLSRWYAEAAAERGHDLDKAASREIVYGMPYEQWKAEHQAPATAEQQAAFEKRGSD